MGKVYKNYQEVISAIDDLCALLDGQRATKTFFSKTVRDLKSLRDRFADNETRVAIIGITSSGKSTLMNSVLGGSLLPTRVGPSSSKQVLCGWDETQEAEIIFDPETGKQKRWLTGTADEIRTTLEKYGDEKYNPGNRECVDEIRVHAPAFRFNRDLVIIDTPGLDAYGLDQHKEVTMKLVLPTVDMVLFLTNVKCDSDDKNLEFIDNATTDDKPLIVVQNKIDAIEEKISKKGVEKTVDEIKQEHRRRLERLLANAKKESVRKAPIVQVSAKSPWKRSNLEELGRILDEQVRINSDFRMARRFHQLTSIVTEMRDALRGKLAQSEQLDAALRQEQRKFAKWQNDLDTLTNYLTEVEDEIKRRMTAISDCCESLVQKVSGKSAKHETRAGLTSFFSNIRWNPSSDSGRSSLSDDVRKTKKHFEKLTQDLNDYFSAAITETQNRVRECCRNMGIDERQLVRTTPFRSQHVSISDGQKTRRIKEEYQVEQKGFLGGAKRFFGSIFGQDDWGYETRTRWVTETYVDVKALLNEIQDAYEKFMQVISEQAKTFAKNYGEARNACATELEERRKEAKAQHAQVLPLKLAESLLSELENLSDSQFAGADAVIRNATVRAESPSAFDMMKWTEVVCRPEVLAAEQLAHAFSFEISYAITEDIMRRSGKRKVVLCGWDADKLKSFREWFIRSDAALDVVDFNRATSMPDAEAVVFLLVNAEQVGSFRGKLLGGGLPTTFFNQAVRQGKIVWVMDSVREHVSLGSAGDSLMEAFAEMMRLAKEALKGTPVFEVMACDRHLYWTVLLHELLFNKGILQTENGRQQFVNEIANVFRLKGEQRHATGRYVTQFEQAM